ncbi:MAG TPA: 3D domain-containing protein [Pyrinomonadaceae bacterium]|jgi:3D (Asp-Asp-Asp) domain-containing protein|nr:3D domain-containing protein [Pyrinomonadaceae bacterium]
MSKSLLGGSAVAALFSASLIFYSAPSIAETLGKAHQKSPNQQTTATDSTPVNETSVDAGIILSSRPRRVSADKLKTPQAQETRDTASAPSKDAPSSPSQPFVATAYALRGRTASGRYVNRGIIAADRRLLPLGTRVRLDAGNYSGEYLVADTGGAVRGRKIDIWVPDNHEAMRFGRRTVKLTVLTHERGNKRPRN